MAPNQGRELPGVEVHSRGQPPRAWTLPEVSHDARAPALGADGTVYATAADKLYAIEASSGALRWTYTNGCSISGPPAVGADGTVYFGDAGWGRPEPKLSAVHGSAGLAGGPWPKFRGDARNTGRVSPTVELRPRLSLVAVTGSGLVLRIDASVVRELELQTTTDLYEWIEVRTLRGVTNGTVVVEPWSAHEPARFYRLCAAGGEWGSDRE